jgi:hypothetical protein
MQLDPNAHLIQQLGGVSSTALERLTAATFASVGYTVLRNLRYEIGGQMAAEADVYASIVTPLRESRVLLECKGGTPSFTEIREFASLRSLLSAPPDDLVLVCQANIPQNRIDLAEKLDVRLVEKTNLAYYVLPLLGGASMRQSRAKVLNRYLAWQVVHEYLTSKVQLHPQLNQHYRCLISELWKVGEPDLQVARSFDAYANQFANTSDLVAGTHGITAQNALYNPVYDDVEAAMYVMLLHRFMNVWAITRWTLQLVQFYDSMHLILNLGANLRNAVSKLSSNPRYFLGFPAFLQTYFFVWGGFIVDARRAWEVEQMARETSTTSNAVEVYLEVLDAIYTGPGSSMTGSGQGITYFKYTPAACRALGMEHRRAADPGYYTGLPFFGGLGPLYEAALDRALSAIGGRVGLRY